MIGSQNNYPQSPAFTRGAPGERSDTYFTGFASGDNSSQHIEFQAPASVAVEPIAPQAEVAASAETVFTHEVHRESLAARDEVVRNANKEYYDSEAGSERSLRRGVYDNGDAVERVRNLTLSERL